MFLKTLLGGGGISKKTVKFFFGGDYIQEFIWGLTTSRKIWAIDCLQKKCGPTIL